MKVQLTARQRKILKKIIKIQLQALRAILKEDCEEDITLYCLENEIDKAELRKLTERNIIEFKYVYKHPESFLDLREVHLSSIKHIFNTQMEKKSLKRVKSELWRKMVVFDELQHNLN